MLKKIIKKILEYKKWYQFKSGVRNFIENNVKSSANSPTVLIWELGGFPLILTRNAIISLALNARGYNTKFVICDGSPVACIQREVTKNEDVDEWSKSCKNCFRQIKFMAENYFIKYNVLSDFIDDEQKKVFNNIVQNTDLNDVINYEYLGINIGGFVWSFFNRYMLGNFTDISKADENTKKIFRKYFYAALVNTFAANQAINNLKPISILSSHGFGTDYGSPIIIGAKNKINSVHWFSGYADFHHYFTVTKDFSRFMLNKINDENIINLGSPLTEKQNALLDNFINNRYFHNNTRDIFVSSCPEAKNVLINKLNIKENNPTVCLFAHVNWDACLNLSTMVFNNSNDWVIESIKKMATIQGVNWIIRVHPSENTDGTAYGTYEVIMDYFGTLPENIIVIKKDANINTYGIFQIIDIGITIYGTIGSELTLFGKPVVCSEESHYAGKGFSIDYKTKEDYFSILDNITKIKPLTEQQIQLARRYAYFYFIQRQIPFNMIKKEDGHWGNLDIKRISSLLPGNDYAMDKICDCVINGNDAFLDYSLE